MYFCEHPRLRIRFSDTWCISHIYYYYYTTTKMHYFIKNINITLQLIITVNIIFNQSNSYSQMNSILDQINSFHIFIIYCDVFRDEMAWLPSILFYLFSLCKHNFSFKVVMELSMCSWYCVNTILKRI